MFKKIDIQNIESEREIFKWGTYGKTGREDLRWVLLKDMSNDHINAILKDQTYDHVKYKPATDAMRIELEYRKNNNIFIKDTK